MANRAGLYTESSRQSVGLNHSRTLALTIGSLTADFFKDSKSSTSLVFVDSTFQVHEFSLRTYNLLLFVKCMVSTRTRLSAFILASRAASCWKKRGCTTANVFTHFRKTSVPKAGTKTLSLDTPVPFTKNCRIVGLGINVTN